MINQWNINGFGVVSARKIDGTLFSLDHPELLI